MFSYAAQTLLDTIDPYSVVSTKLNNGGLTTPLYFSEVDGDSVVPNKVSNPTGSLVYLSPQFAGTEPLATLLGLTTVNAGQLAPNATKSFVQFNSTAKPFDLCCTARNMRDMRILHIIRNANRNR